MPELLMICYYYPPLVDVGALRSNAFSKYLPEFGWIPTVLTVSNPSKSYCRMGNTVPPANVSVLRAPSLFDGMFPVDVVHNLYDRLRRLLGRNPSHELYFWAMSLWQPDIFAPWIPGAVYTAMKIKNKGFDAIYASCSPFSSAVIGALLKPLFKKPLILDFRDPMTKRILQKPESASDRLRQEIEHRVLQRCDKLILLTEESRDRYVKTYPFLKNKVSVVHNGYSEGFRGIGTERPCKNNRFTITYTGDFYAGTLAPEPFFDALRNAIDNGWVREDEILFRYVGERAPWLDRLIQSHKLGGVVEATGYVSLARVKEYLCESDIVLLRGLDPCCLPTKLFEGLALGKVFLALTEPSETERMVKKYSPSSMVFPPADVEGIAFGIRNLYNRWKDGRLRDEVSEEYLCKFDWKQLTQNFVQVLESVTVPSGMV